MGYEKKKWALFMCVCDCKGVLLKVLDVQCHGIESQKGELDISNSPVPQGLGTWSKEH